MVIVQLLGGLGNQMFQYALGRQLARLNDAELKLDTSILLDWRVGKHAVNRNFDLDIFSLTPAFAGKEDIAPYHTTGMRLPEKIFYTVKRKLNGRQIMREQFFHFDASILDLRGDIYLSGTWQSYKYFEQIDPIIRHDFEFIIPMSAHALKLAQQINKVQSVCLNVRRTDYISAAATAKTMGVIGLDYYKEALSLMKEWVGDFEVFVFSDDIVWCVENLNFIEQPVFFVDHHYAGLKFSDYLNLMRQCKHYIIPNSTFAWWGAWLNQDASKKVIAPKHWMNDPAINTNDLIPGTWTRL